nr:non-structural polyprotein [Flumine hepe-like virus 5]
MSLYGLMFDNKGNTFKNLDELQRDYDDRYHQAIQYHLKQQTKPILSDNADINNKAGQGVSAWSKMCNIFFSGWIRCVNRKIRAMMSHEHILSYDESDAKIARKFDKYAKFSMNDEYVEMNTDFTEFDTSHNVNSLVMETTLMTHFGVPNHVIDDYFSKRANWNLVGFSEGIMSLHGHYKQHSGQPNTIGSNTIFNIAAIYACYKIKGLLYFGAKGDDATVKARAISERYVNGEALQKHMGYKIKCVGGKPTEFICNIFTPCGWFPDVLRRAVKVISTIYKDESDFEQSKLNVRDALDVINQEGANLTLMEHYASEYYRIHKKITISQEQIHTIYLYLFNYHKLKFTDLRHGEWMTIDF